MAGIGNSDLAGKTSLDQELDIIFKAQNEVSCAQNDDLLDLLLDSKRKTKTVTACPHTNRKHYAKNMCCACYHRMGRTKLAWKCSHSEDKHYAKGLCLKCYLVKYQQEGKDLPLDRDDSDIEMDGMNIRLDLSSLGNISDEDQ